MSRDSHLKQATSTAARGGDNHDELDAEFSPERARRVSLAGLRHEAIQRKVAQEPRSTEAVHDAAARGVASPTTEMPHAAQIQASFGAAHDVSQIRAHVGGDAAGAMGATAFAAGGHVVFDQAPDLHTAAHEAAHVFQQAQGVQLYGGVGEAGDSYERHADAVADRVVAGHSAADLLGAGASAGREAGAVQRKQAEAAVSPAKQHEAADSADFRGSQSAIVLVAKHLSNAATAIDRIVASSPSTAAGASPQIDQVDASMAKASNELRLLSQRVGSVSDPRAGMTSAYLSLRPHVGELNQGWLHFKAACDRAAKFAEKQGLGLRNNTSFMVNYVELIRSALRKQSKVDSDESLEELHQPIDTRTEVDLLNVAVKENLRATSEAARSVRMMLPTGDNEVVISDLQKVKRHAAESADLLRQSAHPTSLRAHKPAAKQVLAELAALEQAMQGHALADSLKANKTYLDSVAFITSFVRR